MFQQLGKSAKRNRTPKNNYVNEPWPSHLYFEDVNGETQFQLVELILKEVYRQPKFTKKVSWHS